MQQTTVSVKYHKNGHPTVMLHKSGEKLLQQAFELAENIATIPHPDFSASGLAMMDATAALMQLLGLEVESSEEPKAMPGCKDDPLS